VAEGGGEEQTAGAHIGTPDVFISYASHDTHVADNVADALEGQGLKCWIAPRDVTPARTMPAKSFTQSILPRRLF
jgi:hypothetical protein